jgi:hypothetical protein
MLAENSPREVPVPVRIERCDRVLTVISFARRGA